MSLLTLLLHDVLFSHENHPTNRIEDYANTSDVNKAKRLFVRRPRRMNIDDNRTAVKASIRTARRMPCRQYDRLFTATAELLVLICPASDVSSIFR